VNAAVVLQVDASASDYVLGAALLQPSRQESDGTFDEKSLQPVACSSKSLTATKEQRHASLVVEAFKKFDQWLLGKANVTVHTDHQSQQSIFQNDIASALKRLQKMTVFLPCHSFAVFYRMGTSLYLADTLSRAPCIEKAQRFQRSRRCSEFSARISVRLIQFLLR
jgi:hypothetical protein